MNQALDTDMLLRDAMQRDIILMLGVLCNMYTAKFQSLWRANV